MLVQLPCVRISDCTQKSFPTNTRMEVKSLQSFILVRALWIHSRSIQQLLWEERKKEDVAE